MKEYRRAEMEVLEIRAEDIIVTSNELPVDPDDDE